jgi:hypothetical protein
MGTINNTTPARATRKARTLDRAPNIIPLGTTSVTRGALKDTVCAVRGALATAFPLTNTP